MSIRFAKRLFLIAGIYGVLAVAPLFFLEGAIGEQYPPAVTHPEFYYGFAFAALAWQAVYLIMSRDPVRFRPMIPAAMIGKVGFGLSVLVLFALGRLPLAGVPLPSIDLVLAALFAWAYMGLRHQELR